MSIDTGKCGCLHDANMHALAYDIAPKLAEALRGMHDAEEARHNEFSHDSLPAAKRCERCNRLGQATRALAEWDKEA